MKGRMKISQEEEEEPSPRGQKPRIRRGKEKEKRYGIRRKKSLLDPCEEMLFHIKNCVYLLS